jgi:putative ATP-binding cassette transporter
VRWLDKLNYYFLETFNEHTDNPDQRIQEDIGSLISSTLTLALGALSSIVTVMAFILVLWNLSGDLVIPLGKLGVLHFPKYLVWVGIIYALVGTVIAVKIGHPLIGLIFEQQRREANYRFGLIDLRLHAEHIALYRGEKNQQTILQKLFSRVLENWYAIILRQKLLFWFTAGYNQTAVALPFVAVFPTYFSKTIKLGGLMQTLGAFQNIQSALSFIINSYGSIASWQAVSRRLLTFLRHMDEIEKNAIEQNKLVYSQHSSNNILIRHLTINTPRGETLLKDINDELVHGSNYLIKGHSGLGKSTFVRTLARIWPYGAGEITLPANKKMMFLPQTSYMPIGTLRDALLFPDRTPNVSDESLIDWLKQCDLGHLGQRLDEVAGWSGQLSQGELQRVAFIRVLIQQPDWIFLDESTSALGLAHEKRVYGLLKEHAPACSIVAVGHRPSLEAYHDQEIDLERYGGREI